MKFDGTDHAELRVVAAAPLSATSSRAGDQRLGGGVAAERQPVRQHPVAALGEDRLGVELHAVDRQLGVPHAHDHAAFGAGGDLQLGGHGLRQDRQRVIPRRGERVRKSLQHAGIRRGGRCWSCRAAVRARGRRCRRTPRRWPGGPGTRRAAESRAAAQARTSGIDAPARSGVPGPGAEQDAVELSAAATRRRWPGGRRRCARPARPRPSWPRYWTRLNTKLS